MSEPSKTATEDRDEREGLDFIRRIVEEDNRTAMSREFPEYLAELSSKFTSAWARAAVSTLTAGADSGI